MLAPPPYRKKIVVHIKVFSTENLASADNIGHILSKMYNKMNNLLKLKKSHMYCDQKQNVKEIVYVQGFVEMIVDSVLLLSQARKATLAMKAALVSCLLCAY